MTLLGRVIQKAIRVGRRALRRTGVPTTPVPLSAATVDFDDPATAVDPFPAYDVLRAAGPVHFLTRHDAWIVVGHDEVRTAFAMPQCLSNQPYEDVDAVLLAADPPAHTAIRRITSRYFSRDIIEGIGRAAADAVPRLLERRRLDAVGDYAEPISELAAAHLIGLDERARRDVRTAGTHVTDFGHYVRELRALADRAAMYGRLRSDGLNDVQARSLVALFWVASTKTTERVIAAAAFRLGQHDDIRHTLQRDASAVGRFISDVLRLHQPEPVLRRVATSTLALGGTVIPAGAMVYLCIAAANRDPARYIEPHAVRLDRGDAGHLSFGHGIHYCIGAAVARAVTDVAVRGLLAEGREVRLGQPLVSVTWQASMMVRFIDRLIIEM